MKIALLPTVIAIAVVGLLGNIEAVAQYGEPIPPPNVPAAAPAANPPGQATVAAPAAAATPGPPASGPVYGDNGLWSDASGCNGCAVCGGGSCCPPDWYTLQGTRILSHGNIRKIFIAQQASLPNGSYAAIADSTGTVFHVRNDATTVFQAQAGGLLNSFNRPTELFNTKQLGLGIAAGYDMTIGHYFCRDSRNFDHFVEFSFWGLNSWSRQKTLTGQFVPIYDEDQPYDAATAALINQGTAVPLATGKFRGSLRTPFPMVTPELQNATPEQALISLAFNNGLEYDYSYRSTINNFELNGRFSPRGEPDRLVLHADGRWERQCQPGTYMSYLYGIRLMQINETFLFHSFGQGQFNDDWTAVTQEAVGDYDIATHNSLLGVQIGADMTFRQCRWAWGIQSKVSPCVNIANQESFIDAATVTGADHGGPVNRRLVANRYQAGFIGEVSFQATYKFRPTLMGRAAYDLMWITGVALAPEQIQISSATPVNSITTNGTIFAQGVSLGLEWMW